MAWIESHQSLARHRKTLAVVAALKVDRHKLLGHLHELWWWGLDNADTNGRLGQIAAEVLAEAAGWPIRDATRFVGALVDAGFLDGRDGGLVLHDWYDYAGKLNDRRQANQQRMKRARASSENEQETRTDGARASHVQDTVRERVELPDRTGPDRTGPDLTGDVSPPPLRGGPPPGPSLDVAEAIPENGRTADSPNDDTTVPVPKRQPVPKPSKRVTEVDAAFEDALVSEFEAAFGSAEAVRDTIAAALGHQAARKYSDQRAYVRNWLRRDSANQPSTVAQPRDWRPAEGRTATADKIDLAVRLSHKRILAVAAGDADDPPLPPRLELPPRPTPTPIEPQDELIRRIRAEAAAERDKVATGRVFDRPAQLATETLTREVRG